MTKTARTIVPALLLAAGLLGSAHAAPGTGGGDAVQVQVQLAEAPSEPALQPQAARRFEPDGELAADMAERLDPRAVGGIAGAIGIFSIVSAVRRRRVQQQEGLPKPV